MLSAWPRDRPREERRNHGGSDRGEHQAPDDDGARNRKRARRCLDIKYRTWLSFDNARSGDLPPVARRTTFGLLGTFTESVMATISAGVPAPSAPVTSSTSTGTSTNTVAAAVLDASDSFIAALVSFAQFASRESRADTRAARMAAGIALAARDQALAIHNAAIDAGMAEAGEKAERAMESARTAMAISIAGAVIAIAAAAGAFTGVTAATSSTLELAATRLDQVRALGAVALFFGEESATLASAVRALAPATGAITDERRDEILRRLQALVYALKTKPTVPADAGPIGPVPFARATGALDQFIAALRIRFNIVDAEMLASLYDLRNAVVRLA